MSSMLWECLNKFAISFKYCFLLFKREKEAVKIKLAEMFKEPTIVRITGKKLCMQNNYKAVIQFMNNSEFAFDIVRISWNKGLSSYL